MSVLSERSVLLGHQALSSLLSRVFKILWDFIRIPLLNESTLSTEHTSPWALPVWGFLTQRSISKLLSCEKNWKSVRFFQTMSHTSSFKDRKVDYKFGTLCCVIMSRIEGNIRWVNVSNITRGRFAAESQLQHPFDNPMKCLPNWEAVVCN